MFAQAKTLVLLGVLTAILVGLGGSIAPSLAVPFVILGIAKNVGAWSFAALFAPVAAGLIQLSISRSREFHADATGAGFSGDPDALADALERMQAVAARVPPAHEVPATASLFIVNPATALGRVASWFSTHPPIDERVRRLRALTGLHGAPAVSAR